MPLLVICGRPGVGKTTVAKHITQHLRSAGKEVVLVNEEALMIDRRHGYADSVSEKTTRASLKSRIDREVTKDTTVICDSLNFFKGFRYELFCIARSQSTSFCCVFVDASWEVAAARNAARQDPFPEAVFTDLWRRFEYPNERQRWDRPLFVVRPPQQATGAADEGEGAAVPLAPEAGGSAEAETAVSGAAARARVTPKMELPTTAVVRTLPDATEAAPVEAISAALYDPGRLLKSSVATTKLPTPGADIFQATDRVTRDMVQALSAAARSGIEGDLVPLPHCSHRVRLLRQPAPPTLRRWRKDFLQLCAAHPPATEEDAASRFATFLDGRLQG